MEAGKPQPLEDQLPQDLRATASIDDVAATLPVEGDEEDANGCQDLVAAASGGAPQQGEGGAPEGGKRDYVRWLPQEEGVFYSALRGVAGQKPEVCLRHITAQLGGSKDYPQVRHYYYRLIKRLNKLLGEGATLDTRNPLQIHQSMLKFWEVVVSKGMHGTCMAGIMRKPRKSRELSSTVQKGVKAVLQKTSGAAAGAGGVAPGGARGSGPSRKRKPREDALDAAGAAAAMQGSSADVDMADAAEPPAKQQRRTVGPSTRQQCLLAVAEAEVEEIAGGGAAGDPAAAGGAPAADSSRSQTGGHEGGAGCDKLAASSQTAGSQPRDDDKPPLAGAALSFRSSSAAGLSAAPLDGSTGQVGGRQRLQLQLVPLDVATAQDMSAAGLHPFLELTLSSGKSLLSVLHHLSNKWRQAAPSREGGAAGGSLYVHAASDCPIPLRGVCWGGPECDGQLKVGDIYASLNCPTPFQLLYSWAPCPSSLAAAGAAADASPRPGRPPSIQGEQQQPHASQAAQLKAELREALSAVAAAAPAAMVMDPRAAAAGVPAEPSQQQQQQQLQPPASRHPTFMQMLQSGDAPSQPLPVASGSAPAAAAAQNEQQQQQQLAATPAALRGSQAAGGAPLAAPSGDLAQTPGTCDARKPRGLLGLLQTPPTKASAQGRKRTPAAKKQAQSQRKPLRSAGVAVRQGGQPKAAPQQQPAVQAQAGGSCLQASTPIPAGFAPYLWGPMHPHLQQPQQPHLAQPQQPQVPILQQQQPQVLQAAQQFPSAPDPHAGERLAGELALGDSLLGMLGMPTLPMTASPGKGDQQPGSVPPLPGSGDFSLKSWPSLSPPSNFQLPEGFDTGLSPLGKPAAGIAAPPQVAAGRLTGGSKAAAAKNDAMQPGLGATGFSLLLAGEQSLRQQDVQQAAAEQPAMDQPQQAAPPAADTLFGGMSFLGFPASDSKMLDGGGMAAGAAGAIPLLPEKELADLTLDFGSLLGGGDAAPSWLGAPASGARADQPQQQLVGERPFASLFG